MDDDVILEFSKTETGRCQMEANGSLDSLCLALLSGTSSNTLTIARALRNACAGNEENASHVKKMKVVEWIAAYCREIALWKSTGEEEGHHLDGSAISGIENHDKELIIMALCQLLSNFAACGVHSSLFLWSSSFGENGFRDALAAAATVGSRKGISAVISAIHNSIRLVPTDQGTALLCSSRGLSAQILLSAAPTTSCINDKSTPLLTTHTVPSPPSSSSSSSADGITSATTQSLSCPALTPVTYAPTTIATKASNDPVLEWLHILFFHILKCRSNSLLKIFLTLKPRGIGENVWDFDEKVGKDFTENNHNSFDIFKKPDEDEADDFERSIITYEQIIIEIFEDSIMMEELIKIDNSNSEKFKAKTVVQNGNENEKMTVNNEKKCINKKEENDESLITNDIYSKITITEDFLLAVIDIIIIIYDKSHSTIPDAVNKENNSCQNNHVNYNNDNNSNNNKNYDNNDNLNNNKKKTSSGFSLYGFDDLLLLCLNVIGAGLSYPSRDGGNNLRSIIGKTKILDICCKILISNDKKKVDFMSKKTRDRESRMAKSELLKMKEVECRGDDSKEEINTNDNNINDNDNNNNDNNNDYNNNDNNNNKKNDINSNDSQHPDHLTEEEEKEGELVKSALQVMGNLSYGCSTVQDTLRLSGGLSLALSHCATDFRLPFAREWGLFCVRNICEGNKANQDFIHALQPQKIVTDDYLQSLGVQVQIDPSTGKITATSSSAATSTLS